ncbi:MAG: hypothetical protein V4673_14395 [Pseudomonadota bacterium]
MEISRRTVLAGLSAAAVVAAMPIVPAAEAAAPIVEKPPGWWGFTHDGEVWHGKFGSREEAISEALGWGDGEPFSTGRCVFYELSVPTLEEHLAEWIADTRPRQLPRCLADWFEGSNQDADWEGDLLDEIGRADYSVLAADLIESLATACFRLGQPDLIPALFRERVGAICDDDVFLGRLVDDAQFKADVASAGETWLAGQDGIQNAGRCLTPHEEQDHPGEDEA